MPSTTKSRPTLREPAADLGRVYTTTEVAARLRVSAPTVRALARSGALPAITCGRTLRYTDNAVRAFMASR